MRRDNPAFCWHVVGSPAFAIFVVLTMTSVAMRLFVEPRVFVGPLAQTQQIFLTLAAACLLLAVVYVTVRGRAPLFLPGVGVLFFSSSVATLAALKGGPAAEPSPPQIRSLYQQVRSSCGAPAGEAGTATLGMVFHTDERFSRLLHLVAEQRARFFIEVPRLGCDMKVGCRVRAVVSGPGPDAISVAEAPLDPSATSSPAVMELSAEHATATLREGGFKIVFEGISSDFMLLARDIARPAADREDTLVINGCPTNIPGDGIVMTRFRISKPDGSPLAAAY